MREQIAALDDEALRKFVKEAESQAGALRQKTAFANFTPFPFQKPWFESKAQVRALMCANQVGKSTFGCVETIAACLGVRPPALGGTIPDKWPRNTMPGARFLAAGETFDVALRDTILPKIRELVTPEMLVSKPKRNNLGLEVIWKFVSGAELVLMSYQQAKDAFEGAVWNGVWFDEPPPQPIYNAVRRGTMAREGRILITATPLKEIWLLDQLILPSQDPKNPMFGTVENFRAEMHDNCREHNGGALPHEQIESYLASLPEKERAARELGLFSDIQGLEFGYVNKETHVVPDFELPSSWPIVECCDPSMKRGLFMTWMVCDPNDYWYVVQSANIENGSFAQMVADLKRYREQLGRPPTLAIMDQRGGAHEISKMTQTTWFEEFRRLGLYYVPSKEVPLQTLHDWLEPKWDPVKEKHCPKLRMTQSVAAQERGPMWSLKRFIWDPHKSKKAQYTQKAKDLIDCLRYSAGHPGMNYRKLARSGVAHEVQRISLSYAQPTGQKIWFPQARSRKPSYRRARKPYAS